MKHLILFWTLITALSSHAQQSFTATSSRANNYCNGTCTLFDVPELNGNPTAIIFIQPVEVNGVNLDPHPICAYYNGKQWSVINTDNSTMPVGSQFNVQYFPRADDSHFVHIVTKENLVKANSYIDHAGLNGNPRAQFQFFQNSAPNIRGGYLNKEEAKIQYDDAAGKWYVANTSGHILDYATGYNILLSTGTNATAPVTIPVSNPTVLSTPVSNFSTTGPGQHIYMTVVGKLQGTFAGTSAMNKIEITGFEMDITSPKDAVTGMSTGRRLYSPILVQKTTDPSSIQFYKAITSNELLNTITIEVYKTGEQGSSTMDYKIILTNASISRFKQSFTQDQKIMTDSIGFVAQKFELHMGAMVASDSRETSN